MVHRNTEAVIGDVPLYLSDSVRSVEAAPNGIEIGVVQLRAWQLHRISPVPPDLDGAAAYLVRANYDFVVGPEVPAPRWAEVRFDFPLPGATVVDALPRAVVEPVPATSHELTGQLNFARRDGRSAWWPEGSAAGHVPMPALAPRIDCFGIGGDHVQWRHTGGVPAGAHTGCFVLVVPEAADEVPVVASGDYHVDTDPALKLRPVGRPDAFTVALPADRPTSPSRGTAPVASPATRPAGPRVFVSYAHDTPEHKASVRAFCEFLTAWGADVRYDRQGLDVRRNWDRWIVTEILRSDYVLVIASPAYLAAGNGGLPEGEHKGVVFEYNRLVELLHREERTWLQKILPVVLPGRSPEEIPLSFLPGVADHYPVREFTEEGAKGLLRVLGRGRPAG